MIPNATAQHRGKYFDLLLARELTLIQREHEQNSIIYQRLAKSIQRDQTRIPHINRRKISITTILDEQKEQSYVSSDNTSSYVSQKTTDETSSQTSSKYYRHCSKAKRLPPIVKVSRQKRINNDTHWIASVQPTNPQKEPVTLGKKDLAKRTLLEITPLRKQIQSFMETLPTYKGVQRGFDNFAPASLYSRRVPIAVR